MSDDNSANASRPRALYDTSRVLCFICNAVLCVRSARSTGRFNVLNVLWKCSKKNSGPRNGIPARQYDRHSYAPFTCNQHVVWVRLWYQNPRKMVIKYCVYRIQYWNVAQFLITLMLLLVEYNREILSLPSRQVVRSRWPCKQCRTMVRGVSRGDREAGSMYWGEGLCFIIILILFHVYCEITMLNLQIEFKRILVKE